MPRRKWRFTEHTLRKDSTSLSRRGLFWKSEGKCKRGRPRSPWCRTSEKELEARVCPGKSLGRRRRMDTAGEQLKRPYMCPMAQKRQMMMITIDIIYRLLFMVFSREGEGRSCMRNICAYQDYLCNHLTENMSKYMRVC